MAKEIIVYTCDGKITWSGWHKIVTETIGAAVGMTLILFHFGKYVFPEEKIFLPVILVGLGCSFYLSFMINKKRWVKEDEEGVSHG